MRVVLCGHLATIYPEHISYLKTDPVAGPGEGSLKMNGKEDSRSEGAA